MEEVDPATELTVPYPMRIQLLHGYVQLLADSIGVDLLHVKGAAVHPGLQTTERSSMDVDVLVRPVHVRRLISALHAHSWEKLTGFTEGSAFGHAMNLRHDLGLLDLHRHWPGFEISPEEAFDLLWQRRESMEIAGVMCHVPSQDDQRLILLLHFARSGGQRSSDREASWTALSPAGRDRVAALARQFRAEMALAAATGDLERFRGNRGYRLWRYFSRSSGSRIEEWEARFFAARGPWAKLNVARGFVSVNHDLLVAEIGHEPGRSDYVVAYWRRSRTAVLDLATLFMGRRP